MKGSRPIKYEEGEIMSQDPAPDTEVAKNSTITVVLSSGEEAKMVQVPNVVGPHRGGSGEIPPGREADRRTRRAAEVQRRRSLRADVISSDPEAGTEVEEGTEVTIVISLGEGAGERAGTEK